ARRNRAVGPRNRRAHAERDRAFARPYVERAFSNGQCALSARLYWPAGRSLFADVEYLRAGASPQADQVFDCCDCTVDARPRAAIAAIVPPRRVLRGTCLGGRRNR